MKRRTKILVSINNFGVIIFCLIETLLTHFYLFLFGLVLASISEILLIMDERINRVTSCSETVESEKR